MGPPAEEVALAAELSALRADEHEAYRKYEQLSDQAYSIGRPDIAAELQSIAEDEHRHSTMLDSMLNTLRWY